MKKLQDFLNKRSGFFLIAIFLYWAKTYLAYTIEFNLGVSGLLQHFILLINPFPIIVILMSLGLYFKDPKKSFSTMWFFHLLASILLYANILYYREFADFLTTNVAVGAGGISTGLFTATFNMLNVYDFVYCIDVFILGYIVFRKLWNSGLRSKPVMKKTALLTTVSGIILFGLNIGLSEINRPQLLLRTFDRNYIVKYLGLNF